MLLFSVLSCRCESRNSRSTGNDEVGIGICRRRQKKDSTRDQMQIDSPRQQKNCCQGKSVVNKIRAVNCNTRKTENIMISADNIEKKKSAIKNY
jgi:hypothetical protein